MCIWKGDMMDKKTKKQFYFIFILAALALLVYFLVDIFMGLNFLVKAIIGIIAVIAIAIIFTIKSGAILFLEEFQRAVIQRFGRLHRVGGPGWTLIIPGLEKSTIVDLRTQTLDIPRQNVITKDNVMIDIDAVIYLRVDKDPKEIINSVMNVENYKEAARIFIKSNIRDVIGNMDLSDVISNVNDLNQKMKSELKEISKDWGIVVDSVEVKEIKIPDEVIDAMHKQKAAIQRKLAVFEDAAAEKEKIRAIHEAASGLSDTSLSYYYIKALEEMSKGASTKIIFPMEFTKLAGILTGKMNASPSEKSQVDTFLQQYGPMMAKHIEKEAPKETLEKAPKEAPKKALEKEVKKSK